MRKQVGNQNSKRLSRQAAFGKLRQTHFCGLKHFGDDVGPVAAAPGATVPSLPLPPPLVRRV